MAQDVNIWVDPLCPYAWMTSQWMLEVEKVRDIRAVYNIMSLSVLNEGRDELPERYKEMLASGWGPVRIGIAAEQAGGKDALRAYYLAIGALHHNGKQEMSPELFRNALEKAGLDPALADAADDTSLDDALKASHHAGMDAVGDEVGTPVIHFPKPDGSTTAFFGPVLTPPPTGDEAGRLWDGLETIATTEGLYELKRSRDVSPQFLPVDG